MSEQTKDRHKKENTVELNTRVPPHLRVSVLQYQQSNGLHTRTEAVITLLEKGFSAETLDFQTCKFRSEIPAHYLKFVNCRKDRLTITQEQCMACSLFRVVRVPLMTIEKYEELKDKRKQELQAIRIEIQQLEPNTRAGLLKTIKEKDTNLRIMQDLLREKTESCTKLTEEIRTMQKVEQKPQIMERVTEKKETITEKFIPQQPQQPKIPSLLVLCPRTGENVSFGDVCEKTCNTFTECPNYQETAMLKNALGKR